MGFHVLECGTNTLATYPAFCTQPAGEGCRKNCNIVCNMFFSSFKISTLKSGFILNQKLKKNGVQVVFLNYTMVSMLMSLYGQYVLECWVKGVVEMTALLLRMFSVSGLLKRMRVLKLLFIVFYSLGLNKFQ